MLDIVFILLLFLAIILMLYSLSERNIAFIMFDAVLWLILALFMLQGVEVPYEMFNATSGNIETGVHTIQTNLTPLAYLFMGISAVLFIVFVTMVMETLSDYRKIK